MCGLMPKKGELSLSLVLHDTTSTLLRMKKSHRRDNRQREGIQRSAKVDVPGLVIYVSAVGYHSCLNLPAAFTQPGAPTLADLSRKEATKVISEIEQRKGVGPLTNS